MDSSSLSFYRSLSSCCQYRKASHGSLGLALSFGFYGLIKKGVKLSSDVAMLVESGLLLPFVAIYLIFFSPESFSSYSSMEMFLLAISGVVTAVPLLCFSEAVKRAPLNLIGFIQYLNPTIQLLVAILILVRQSALEN